MGCAGRISPEFGRVSPMTAAGGFRVKRHASSFCIAQAAVNRSIRTEFRRVELSRRCLVHCFRGISAGSAPAGDETEPSGSLLADIGDRETLLPGAQR